MSALENWELEAPAYLQYWPKGVGPSGPGVWPAPQAFDSLREAIVTAMTRSTGYRVAWILLSSGRTLLLAEIEVVWRDLRSALDGGTESIGEASEH